MAKSGRQDVPKCDRRAKGSDGVDVHGVESGDISVRRLALACNSSTHVVLAVNMGLASIAI